MSKSDDSATSVYRYYDRLGVLLYVGITGRGVVRNFEHSKYRAWWSLVDRQEVEHYADRATAHRREVELIRRHTPPFNTQHNPDRREALAAYRQLPDNPLGHVELAATFRRLLPLNVRGCEGGRFVATTLVAHAAFAARLDHQGHVTIGGEDGGCFGHVDALEIRGPVAVISGTVRSGLLTPRASLRYKTRQRKNGDASYLLRSVMVDAPAELRFGRRKAETA